MTNTAEENKNNQGYTPTHKHWEIWAATEERGRGGREGEQTETDRQMENRGRRKEIFGQQLVEHARLYSGRFEFPQWDR